MAIRLIAFDFGSTTSKALLASAALVKNIVTGRTEIQALQILARTEPVFTPFLEEEIDEARLNELVESWLHQSEQKNGSEANPTIAGGVIVTGLAAKKRNAKTIANAVRKRIGEAVVAVADDPSKESWLAFMGCCSALSAAHPEHTFINMDIGGGTTNISRGRNQSVLATGSLWVGARHFRFQPGTYSLEGFSDFGERLLSRLNLKKSIGDELEPEEIRKIVDFYLAALAGLLPESTKEQTTATHFLEHLRFPTPQRSDTSLPILTFSGGVGELVYRIARGESLPTTPWGDLGVDLAQGIANSAVLARDLQRFVPVNLGRATVSGLAFHGVEASGATVFLPRPEILPLRDLPLIGRISNLSKQMEIDRLIASAKDFSEGSCLRVDLNPGSLENLRDLAGKIATALRKNRFPKGVPLIIFLTQNLGKTFGQYATDWGRIAVDFVVVDEIDNSIVDEKAYFASISKSDHENKTQHLLVSFYGGLDPHA